jgi:hypothetical protein
VHPSFRRPHGPRRRPLLIVLADGTRVLGHLAEARPGAVWRRDHAAARRRSPLAGETQAAGGRVGCAAARHQ